MPKLTRKPVNGGLLFCRTTPALREKVVRIASVDRRTFSQVVLIAVEEYVNKRLAQPKP